LNSLFQTLKNLGPARLVGIGGGGLAMLGFLIYLVARISSPTMEMLFGGLESGDANQIITRLASEKVAYELRNNGGEIWVPSDRKLEMRMKLAESGLPAGGSLATGYELFDKTDMMGSTSFVQNVNLLRAMEGELARTIHAINGVKSARVHLVLPKREAFSRDVQEPSASIVLKMEGAGRLTHAQVQAIQHLVAAAVPKLKPSRISIVDEKGTLLARSTEDDREAMADQADEMKLGTEQRLQRTIEELLERSIGGDKVRAEVSVEMDLNRTSTTEETYDPDSKVERSHVTVNEDEKTQDTENNSVSVQQNLPDAGANNAGARSNSVQNRTQETVNYEISKTTVNHIKELGTIKRISAAVLVDGRYGPPADGQKLLTYIPRDDKEMEQLTALVKSAIGFDPKRGDQVEVTNLSFAGHDLPEAEAGAEKLFGIDKDLLEKIASNLGLSLVAILFLLLVLRPLVSRAVESLAAQAAAADQRALGLAGGLALPGAAMPPTPSLGMLPEELESVDELIDIDKVEGRVKASSIRKIGEIVEKHPEEALSIIRNWMYTE
jgi:flagellar M-ring protein FliF